MPVSQQRQEFDIIPIFAARTCEQLLGLNKAHAVSENIADMSETVLAHGKNRIARPLKVQ